MNNTFLSEQTNDVFIYLIDENDKSFYARLHRRFVRSEIVPYCHYLDLSLEELKAGYYRVLVRYALDIKMKRIDQAKNLHLAFFNDVIEDLMEYKRTEIKKLRARDVNSGSHSES